MSPWRRLELAYGYFLAAIAAIAAVLLLAITALIVVDVLMRNTGMTPWPYTLTVTEYSLLYVTMLGSPWLVRIRGHVFIELVTAAIPERARAILGIVTSFMCAAACLLFAYYSLDVTIDDYVRGAVDVRSFDMPRWLLFGVMPPSFALMSAEFVRLIFTKERLFSGRPGVHE